jgi:hypothetical protein
MSIPRTHPEPGGGPPPESKDIVVFMVRRETKCAECGSELFDGNMLRMEDIRHEHTRYDEFLMRFGDRANARSLVRDEIEKVLASWERNANTA